MQAAEALRVRSTFTPEYLRSPYIRSVELTTQKINSLISSSKLPLRSPSTHMISRS